MFHLQLFCTHLVMKEKIKMQVCYKQEQDKM